MTQIHEHALGLTWVMDDAMQRGSHALVDETGRVWLVDPVDDGPALARVAALGDPAGVLQLLDRHDRDCAAIAERFDVPRLKVPETLPADAPFVARRVVHNRLWRAVGAGPVGVHPLLRPRPPHGLAGLEPADLLVGHGPPVGGTGTAEAVDTAIAHAWRDTPRLLLKLPSLILAKR
jgi:hypothetical protein